MIDMIGLESVNAPETVPAPDHFPNGLHSALATIRALPDQSAHSVRFTY
jgi:hypothetical protein